MYNLPDVYNKFIYTGIPLEYYFSECTLTIFYDMLPLETVLRLIDIFFLESIY